MSNGPPKAAETAAPPGQAQGGADTSGSHDAGNKAAETAAVAGRAQGGAGSSASHESGRAAVPAATHEPVFVGDTLRRLEALFPSYPTKQACLLPALWMVQEARGWISQPAMAEVGQVLGLTPAYVKGVVTFYTMYHTHPVGRHFIQVCTTSPCHICGAEDTMKALLKETGCGELGATSPDGRFTVSEVECLGACGFPTPILIDDDFIESVTPERVPGILKGYK